MQNLFNYFTRVDFDEGDLKSILEEICDDYINRFNITKIGIGCPGNIVDGIVTFASNLGWKNYEILKDFSLKFPNCKIYVDNDGNAACKAEMKFGNLNNVSNGLFVTIGKGVGGAIIIDNKIVKGHNNKGGRFGHTVIHTNGRKCNCGRRGCFETYASVAGLLQTVKEQNQKWKNTFRSFLRTAFAGQRKRKTGI